MATDGTDQPAGGADETGAELARAVLDAARVRREARPSGRKARPGSAGKRLRGYSGAGTDPRDPQRLGDLISRLVKARGWQRPTAEARIFGTWEVLVGADVATHCRPVKLADGELTIEAESTAWATQLRGLSTRLLARVAAEVGPEVVRRIHVHGPVAPSWAKGPKRVRGRGPRDTYG
ncbi:MAG TPA: DciA family protein [Micromonosporaceae bacterium]